MVRKMDKWFRVVFIVFCVLECALSRELHPIEPQPGHCFDSYKDVQPINLSDLAKACVERLPTKKECYGLKLVTDEIMIVRCQDDAGQLEKDLHLIENKPGLCFKIHTPNQPRLFPNPRKPEYTDLFQSCTEWLEEDKNCLGLRTQNNEVLVLYCKGITSRRRPGCYKIINRDKREEIVCQKINKKEGCEIITTRTSLTIVIACPLRGYSVRDVKTRKSRSQN